MSICIHYIHTSTNHIVYSIFPFHSRSKAIAQLGLSATSSSKWHCNTFSGHHEKSLWYLHTYIFTHTYTYISVHTYIFLLQHRTIFCKDTDHSFHMFVGYSAGHDSIIERGGTERGYRNGKKEGGHTAIAFLFLTGGALYFFTIV